MQPEVYRSTSNHSRARALPAGSMRYSWKFTRRLSVPPRTDRTCCHWSEWNHCSRACEIFTHWREGVEIEKCKLKNANFKLMRALLGMRPTAAASNLQFSFCNFQFSISSRKTTIEIL